MKRPDKRQRDEYRKRKEEEEEAKRQQSNDRERQRLEALFKAQQQAHEANGSERMLTTIQEATMHAINRDGTYDRGETNATENTYKNQTSAQQESVPPQSLE